MIKHFYVFFKFFILFVMLLFARLYQVLVSVKLGPLNYNNNKKYQLNTEENG